MYMAFPPKMLRPTLLDTRDHRHCLSPYCCGDCEGQPHGMNSRIPLRKLKDAPCVDRELQETRERHLRSRREIELRRPASHFLHDGGEIGWRFSNLLKEDDRRDYFSTFHRPQEASKRPRPGTLTYEFPGPLYPKLEEVAAIKAIPTAETVFDEPHQESFASMPRSSLTRENSQQSRSSCDERVGAFRENRPPDYHKKSAKPPPPQWVHEPSNPDFDYKSDGSGEDWGKPSSNRKSDYPRNEVEVSPGNYMELRGSEETMAAVMNGQDKVVQCISCDLQLRCVPDADYVLCPDCRVLSPVPQSEYSPENTDDDEYISPVNRRTESAVARKKRVGGLGLGLKLEHHC